MVLNTILTEFGHRADFAGSGEAAVEAVARGGYDLVLMDVTLSGIDGLEATRAHPRAAGAGRRIPVIGISALQFGRRCETRDGGRDERVSRQAGHARCARAGDCERREIIGRLILRS